MNYILIGPPEREAHPGVEERFNSIPNLMPLAFKNGTISIYEVQVIRQEAECLDG